ncbi:MAG: AAA family ATPase [Lysobacteraceae bacterium]
MNPHNDKTDADALRDLSALERMVDEPGAVRLIRADSITLKPIRWLWPGWLACGKLHVLAGAPGTGKTTIALALAAYLTTGRQWPDGSRCEPGAVLVWSGEDDPADTLAPRLAAAGADLSRVHFVGSVTGEDGPRPFDPSRDLMALHSEVRRIGCVRLLIADPVVSAVAGDSHKNGEVRRALQPLVDLAAMTGCAVLGISHFSKGTAGREPLERVTGSIAFGAVARVVLVTAKADDGRLLARAKSNIGPDGGGFAYDLELVEVEGIEASRVRFGAALEGTARDLLGDVEAADSPRDEALEWLESVLWAGPVPVKNIQAEATASGTGWRTVQRAKSDLGVIAERVSEGKEGKGYWQWRLPKDEASKAATSKAATPTTDVGGLAEKQAGQGVNANEVCKAANSPEWQPCDGVADEVERWTP